MIYKLIILTASLLFIWEFMKVRSTAVAQVEKRIQPAIYDKIITYQDLPKRAYDFLGKEYEAQRLSGYNEVHFKYDGIVNTWSESKQTGKEWYYHPARTFTASEIANLQKVAWWQEKINNYTISLMLTDKQINQNSWLKLSGV